MEKITAIYFSPTHGTKTYIEAIASKLSFRYEIIDLTQMEMREKNFTFDKNDLVIVGAPVYMGRLPIIENGLFENLHGHHTPVILNVVYGNREFEDALLEEKNILENHGFLPIAGAAWIAPHTFSNKIARNRPDENDFQIIDQFVKQIQNILKNNDMIRTLPIPGNFPYREVKNISFHPVPQNQCCYCYKCANICPVQAISLSDPYIVETNKCLSCFACIQVCPTHTRQVKTKKFALAKKALELKLAKKRKEPELFF